MMKLRKFTIFFTTALLFGIFSAMLSPANVQANERLQTPENLRVTGTNNTLSWNFVPNATSYTIRWGIGVSGQNSNLTTTNNQIAHITDFLDPTIFLPGQPVTFAVTAHASGFSDSLPASFSWTMPDGATSQNTWHVDVRQSWAASSGSGNFRAGSTVTINAGHRHNFYFLGWSTSHNILLANPFSPTTTFTMPQANVQVTAVWVHVDDWTGWDWPSGTWPDWWWNQWPNGQFPDWWWNQWPGTYPPDWWWSGWQPPYWQLPNWQRPNINTNWQVQHRGGISFSYAAGNFPETLTLNQGSTINFQLRVDRHLASFSANFVGQWLRNGYAHGSAFPITLSSAGFADVSLNISSLASGNSGNYSLRVATVLNGVTTHVDTSRTAALSIAGQGQATVWPLQPELPGLPNVNPMPTPRPALHVQPAAQSTAGVTGLAATPAHNHDLVMNSLYSDSAVLQILPATSEIRLHGNTLDAMINSNTTLFVVNDLVWVVMPPDFLAHLRERVGSLIGPNGGTFNIGIQETRGGATLIAAQVDITTTINGTTQALTSFNVPYSLAIELWDFGMANADSQHMAVFHTGVRLPSYVNPETGVLSLNVMTTGNFGVNYVID